MISITKNTIFKILLLLGVVGSLFFVMPKSADAACTVEKTYATRFRTAEGVNTTLSNGFFTSEVSRPFLYVDIDTDGCTNSNVLYVSILGLHGDMTGVDVSSDDSGDLEYGINDYAVPLGSMDDQGRITVAFKVGSKTCYTSNDPYDCMIIGMIQTPQSDSPIQALLGNVLGRLPYGQAIYFAEKFGPPTAAQLGATGDTGTQNITCTGTATNSTWYFQAWQALCGSTSQGGFDDYLLDFYNSLSYPSNNPIPGGVFDQQTGADTYRLAFPGIVFNCPGVITTCNDSPWLIPTNPFLPYGETHPSDQGAIQASAMPDVWQETYIPLAPLPFEGLNGGEISNLGSYLASIFRTGIVVAIILSVIMIVFHGIAYMTVGAIQKKQDYRQKIGNTVLGLVLALGSWLILNTISPNLASNLSIGIPFVSLSGDEPDPNWAEGNAADGTLLCKNKKYHHKLNGQNIVKGLTMWPGDSNQRTQLQAAGISINTPNNCIGSGFGAGCTSMYFASNINTQVMNQITAIKQSCDDATDNGVCTLKITGGSECWLHSSHGPEKRIIDISATDSNFNAWVVESASDSTGGNGASPDENGFPNNKKTYKIPGYGKFLAEVIGQTGNTTAKHWHITLD